MSSLSRLSIGQILVIKNIVEFNILPNRLINKNYGGIKSEFKRLFSMFNNTIWNKVRKELPHIWNSKKKIEALTASSCSWTGIFLWKSLLYINNKNSIDINLEEADIDVILLYIGSDYILDDDNVPLDMKKEMKTFVKKVRQAEVFEDKDIRYKEVLGLINILRRVIRRSPNSKNALWEAWDAEILVPEDNFESYFQISAYKGWKTVSMAAAIITNGGDFPGSKELGSATQHVDDMMDWKTDFNDGINTAATHSIKHDNFDYYIYRALISCNNIGDIFMPIRAFFINCIASCGYHNPNSSSEIKDILSSILISTDVYDIESFIGSLVEEQFGKKWVPQQKILPRRVILPTNPKRNRK